jgi:hypothetical protein
MGESEVAGFLTHLSVNRNVAPATQGQALNALVFLYRKVLNKPLGETQGIVRAKRRGRIPVVLTQLEVSNLLSNLEGVHWLGHNNLDTHILENANFPKNPTWR